MRIIYGALLVTLFLYNNSISQQPKDVAGTYQWCPFPCVTVRINTDFTFDYLLDGDLYNKQKSRGTWEFTGEKEIRIRTPERKLEIQVSEEKVQSVKEGIRVQTIDTHEAIWPGITIIADVNGKQHSCETDREGICDLPVVNEIKVQNEGRNVAYLMKDRGDNYLLIKISPFFEPYVDERLRLSRNGELCTVPEDSKGLGNCYSKLSKGRAARLFK
jgi:hypothetical protein